MTLNDIIRNLFSRFTRRAYNRETSRNHVSNAILSELKKGIRFGESIPNLSKRVRSVENRSRSSALMVARTETNRVSNRARMDTYDRAEALGFNVRKQWISTSDSRTRDSHADMNGQTVDKDEPFISGDGNELDFPGDPNAPPEDTINCRCATIPVLE